ncbi:MAG: hypothetical protein AAF485_15890 [Chloroflexota bacterium]
MRTIDGQLLKQSSWLGRLQRDIKLLWRIGQMLFAYLVVGRQIRQAYRAKEAQGDIYWVDEELSS